MAFLFLRGLFVVIGISSSATVVDYHKLHHWGSEKRLSVVGSLHVSYVIYRAHEMRLQWQIASTRSIFFFSQFLDKQAYFQQTQIIRIGSDDKKNNVVIIMFEASEMWSKQMWTSTMQQKSRESECVSRPANAQAIKLTESTQMVQKSHIFMITVSVSLSLSHSCTVVFLSCVQNCTHIVCCYYYHQF